MSDRREKILQAINSTKELLELQKKQVDLLSQLSVGLELKLLKFDILKRSPHI